VNGVFVALGGLLALLAAAAPAVSQQDIGGEQRQIAGEVRNLEHRTLNLEHKILDLVYKIEDVGGRVQALQVRETATETRIELPADILFDFDKADIRSTAEPALKQAADVLRQRARGTVTVEGHTDSKGTPAYNQRLSERRAKSVQQWLVEREGLRNVRFATKAFGAERPVAPNAKPNGADDPEGRQKNRRVEIVFGRR
jgi:outer membrane protein OmpA-like peptidoglycan-associated protein